jgi:NAD(P) transhydrogenase subunit beta
MSFRRDDAALALQPFGSLLSLIIDKDLAADEREVRHPPEVPYDQVFEMEDINGEFQQADVAIVLGANDVVNPAALQNGSVIYGMPILEAYKSKTVIVNKRSMAAGYAGLDNELCYMDKTMMVFGDAKKVVEEMGKAIE